MAETEKVAVVDEIRSASSADADAAVLTEYRGLNVAELADAARRVAAGRHRVQDLQEHAGPLGPRKKPASS